MKLADLHRIKLWHVSHRRERPLEYHLWDVMLTFWLMGWVGWLPAFAFDAMWATPLCLAGTLAPGLYVAWRIKASRAAAALRLGRRAGAGLHQIGDSLRRG